MSSSVPHHNPNKSRTQQPYTSLRHRDPKTQTTALPNSPTRFAPLRPHNPNNSPTRVCPTATTRPKQQPYTSLPHRDSTIPKPALHEFGPSRPHDPNNRPAFKCYELIRLLDIIHRPQKIYTRAYGRCEVLSVRKLAKYYHRLIIFYTLPHLAYK